MKQKATTLLAVIFMLACALHGQEISHYRFQFLTNDLTVVDGRPVFSPDGKTIVFMRQPNDHNPGSPAELYTIAADGSQEAKLLFDGATPKAHKRLNATRPDYSWHRKKYEIAFDAVDSGIWILDIKTKKVKQVLESVIDGKTYTWSYPAWYPDGKSLSVTNYNEFDHPLYHMLVKVNTCKRNSFTPLTNNQLVWPGMSSVSQKHPKTVCFAGQAPVAQPPQCSCTQGCLPDGYAQDCNQIWVQSTWGLAPIDNKQGRAPWFSPNQKYIVFESNRYNPDHPEIYRLVVYSCKDCSLRPVTPPSLNVQHAKWSPDGTKLVFAVNLFGGAQGIALVHLGKEFSD